MNLNDKEYTEEMMYEANQVATEDIDAMSVEPYGVNWEYRNDAIEKKMEELLELWSSIEEEE